MSLPSQHFGKFVRTEKLGAGGMGEVWKAWDRELNRWVALKFLLGDNGDELAKFKREAQTAGRLNHPNIAAIYDVGQAQDRHFIAMQFVEGQTLKTFPRDDRRLLVRLVRDAATAVHYAHEQGIVHRDLKPENIMAERTVISAQPSDVSQKVDPSSRLRADGRKLAARAAEPRVYVMDFGLARAVQGGEKSPSVSGMVVGTPAYMSPEQARGERADARSDVYSLGATLYELLTDRQPFKGGNVFELLMNVQQEEPKAPRNIDPRIDRDLETIVLKCMQKEAGRRYPGAADLADDLGRWLEGEAIAARPASVAYRVRKGLARHKAMASAVAMAVIAVIAVPLLVQSSGERARGERFRAAFDAAMVRVVEFERGMAARSPRREELGRAAAKALEEALAIDAAQPTVWVAMGRCRRLLGEEVDECWEKALAAHPGHAEALFERGRGKLERYQRGRVEPGMIHTAGRIIHRSLPPERHEERLLRESGEADLEGARRNGLAGHRAGYLEALSAFGRADYQRAESLLARYVEEAPWEPGAWSLLGRARQYLGQLPQGAEALTRAIELDPKNARSHYHRGHLYFEIKRYDEAEQDFSRMIELRPESCAGHNMRGGLYARQKRYEEAERDYSRAIELNPGFASAHLNRGSLYVDQKRYAEAERDLSRAIELDPEDAVPHYSRGCLLSEQKRYEEAERDYSRAIQLDAAYPRAHYNRGLLFADQKRYEEAERDYSRAIELDPEFAWAHFNRGCLFIYQKRYEEAERDFSRAIELNPRFAPSHYNRGSAYFSRGRYADAIRDWERAIALDAALEATLRSTIEEARAKVRAP